ncbi:hypothetical protein FQA47_022874 [Oryzias melastigma]|uniref:Uncharacterized protein n=1 Tax=Oryzias melastigma TaxID=30732 RepID=A0A834F987_ORYME|nr:hypothetical protein FQA47_022874 [Oryzias melastigma]
MRGGQTHVGPTVHRPSSGELKPGGKFGATGKLSESSRRDSPLPARIPAESEPPPLPPSFSTESRQTSAARHFQTHRLQVNVLPPTAASSSVEFFFFFSSGGASS